MSFERACSLDEFREGEAIAAVIGDQEIAVARDGDEFFAVEDICSHAAVALSEGEVEGCTLECWLHGSRFDLRTGKPTGLPATEPVSTFPVEVRGNDVYVDVDHHPERSCTPVSTLEIKDLHVSVKTDDEDKEILKGVTLTIKDGETHAIMGPNGSGKSTLAYSIAGHPKYTVTSGSVTLDGAGRAGDDGRRAGPRRAVPGHAVPGRGARRVGVELPAHGQDRDRRRGAEAAHLGQGRQHRPRPAQPRPDVRPALGQRGLLRW